MKTHHLHEKTDPRIIACYQSKILPSLPEEDECERKGKVSCSDVSFDESLFSFPPRRAPQPPQRCPSGDIKLCLAGKSFDFPCPPLEGEPMVSLTRSPATRILPVRFRKRAHSPASSISSTASSSSGDDAVSRPPLTPNTSDDEYIPTSLSVTAPNTKRLSVLFVKSMPDLRPPSPKIATIEMLEEDDEADWLTQEMQDFVTLSPTAALEGNMRSRPESFLPPLRTSNSFKGLCTAVGPSAQLDPTFHFCQKKTRSFVVPSRPPPPPPIQICPASPLNGVFAVSSPCLSTTTIPPTPISSRPPPRSSIPCDVDELMQMDMDDFDLLEEDLAEARDSYLDSPFNSIFNAYQYSPVVSIGFGVDDLPATPSSFAFSDDSHHFDTPQSPLRRSNSSISTASPATRRLRSKWSTSTLGSVYNSQSQSSSWMSKFSFKKGSNKEKAVPSPTFISPSKLAKKEKRRKFTGADIIVRRSYEVDDAQIGRRDSRGSRNSSESTESSPSPGLRRKPIPVEIFMKQ